MNSKPDDPSNSGNRKGPTAVTASWLTPPSTHEERLQRIEAMRQCINGHIQFICQVASLNGSSAEAKGRAVTAFYERMVQIERQLSRIRDELQLS